MNTTYKTPDFAAKTIAAAWFKQFTQVVENQTLSSAAKTAANAAKKRKKALQKGGFVRTHPLFDRLVPFDGQF